MLHNSIAFTWYVASTTALNPENANHIYYLWVNSFYDFLDYLTVFVYDRALTQSVINTILYLLFFLLALYFVVRFIFIRNK